MNLMIAKALGVRIKVIVNAPTDTFDDEANKSTSTHDRGS